MVENAVGDLPPDLEKYVTADNLAFDREIVDWDTRQLAKVDEETSTSTYMPGYC